MLLELITTKTPRLAYLVLKDSTKVRLDNFNVYNAQLLLEDQGLPLGWELVALLTVKVSGFEKLIYYKVFCLCFLFTSLCVFTFVYSPVFIPS